MPSQPNHLATYNLLEERWIPVRREDGSVDWIRPAQIAERENPPLCLASPRPDFDGALAQFLIGLLQTQAPPGSERDWRKWFETPPDPDELHIKFLASREAFFLDGGGPRFFQDLRLSLSDSPKANSVDALLLEMANAELFVRARPVSTLSYPAAAMALLTLQLNAPSGGRGHRTSLRGGGPLTTLLLGDTLWRTAWLNVLPLQRLASLGNPNKTANPEHVFPWLAPTRTSEGNRGTSPNQVSPLQMYWAMPRRIRLDLESEERGRCDLLGLSDVPIVAQYLTRSHGVKYEGFKHPLTPHQRAKATEFPNPKKGQPTGLPYREWPQLVLQSKSSTPAAVVQYALEVRSDHVSGGQRLWVFGFDTDNMKARCFYEHRTPLFAVESDQLAEFSEDVSRFVEASETVRKTLIKQLLKAMKRRPKDVKDGWKKTELATASQEFWRRTEDAFFRSIAGLHQALASEASTEDLRKQWLTTVQKVALAVFDSAPAYRSSPSVMDVKRVVLARRDLGRFSSPSGKKLRELVGLAPLKTRAGRSGERKSKNKEGSSGQSATGE